MIKTFLAGIVAISLSVVAPVATQAEENNIETTDISLVAQFESQLENVTDTTTKYTTTNLNVREEPNLESEVVQTLPINTPVEIVAEIDGWAMITTDTGYVYIVIEYLSETPIANRWNYITTPEERNLIYRIVMLESGAESDLGQQAVTEVIMNMTLYPDLGGRDIHRVLSKKNQFSTWKNVNSSRANPTEQVKRNVDLVLEGKTNILPISTIYFSRKAQNKRIQTVIGNHVFCNR